MAFTRFFLAHRQATTSVSTVSFQLPINLLYESTMENQFFRCTLHIFSYIVHLNDQKFIFIISAQRKQPLLRIVFDLCHIIHHHKVRSYFLCCKLHSWHQKLIHKNKVQGTVFNCCIQWSSVDDQKTDIFVLLFQWAPCLRLYNSFH